MATLNSTTYDAQVAAEAKAGNFVGDAALLGGRVKAYQFVWTVPAGTATADVVNLGKLPAGLTVIPGLCSVTGAAASVNTVGVGFDGAPTAIAAAVNLNTAGTKILNSLVGSYKVTSRDTLQLTLSDTLTQGVTLYFNIVGSVGE